MKKRKTTLAKKLFVMVSAMLWFVLILFSLYVLKTGGHLRPKAADLGEVVDTRIVVGEGGIGIRSARVVLTKEGKSNYFFSDSNGQLVINNINYGEYSLSISASGYRDFSSKITVDSNGRNYYFGLVK